MTVCTIIMRDGGVMRFELFPDKARASLCASGGLGMTMVLVLLGIILKMVGGQ